ncbi:hypothetical protein [Dielma fastidiosa]|uniref:hypothetical protein n=1 Tax=Dielma fastidiosa TaxID=1034346 RepID=UPI00356185B6
MKKTFKKMLALALILNIGSYSIVRANDQYEIHEAIIESFILSVDNGVADVHFVKELYDVKGNLSFVLFTTDNNTNYAVMTIDGMAISEVSEGNIYNLCNVDEVQYYLGPHSFLTQSEYNEFLVSTYEDSESENELATLVDATDAILNVVTSAISSYITIPTGDPITVKPITGSETGISYNNSVIQSFKSEYWENSKANFGDLISNFDGVCGSIASSMLLTYFNEEIISIFDSDYSYSSSKYPHQIMQKVVPLIDGIKSGATIGEVKSGIKEFLYVYSDYSNDLYVKDTTNRSTVVKELNAKRPIVIYVADGGSANPYGLHYVLGFSYVGNTSEQWFHVADNWKNLAWVNNLWAHAFVYFS